MNATAAPLRGISSMATRQLLADLAGACQVAGGPALVVESVGGVDAARRVREGEAFDLVFLAADALARLAAEGHVLADSSVALVRSQVAVAVAAGAAIPDISSAEAVQQAVVQAEAVGYSTGPSGTALLALFERWGVLNAVQPKLRQAPAGVPVAAMVARGEVTLGFQQRSEMMTAPGITVIGDLPAEIAIETIFSGGIAALSTRTDEARAALQAFVDPAMNACKQRNGMTAA